MKSKPPKLLGRPMPPPFDRPSAAPRSSPFASEPPTVPVGRSAAIYQTLLGVFDSMDPAQRIEFIELAVAWSSLDAKDRRVVQSMLSGLLER